MLLFQAAWFPHLDQPREDPEHAVTVTLLHNSEHGVIFLEFPVMTCIYYGQTDKV